MRPRRPIVYLCIGVIALAAFLPGFGAFDHALVVPCWVLLQEQPAIVAIAPAPRVADQPCALASLLPSRAPPAASVA